jgi:hypothetical protein
VRVDPGLRNALNDQATMIQDAIDVATIQDDIIRAVKEDSRMADFKRAEFLKDLDGKILPLTTVYSFSFGLLMGSCSIVMPILWDTLRFVWRYSRRPIFETRQKSTNVGIRLSRKAHHPDIP